MSARHTPGPYHAEGPDPFGDYNILHPANSLAVAAVVSNMRHDAEVEANARLIASAPELLEAAQKALNYITNTEGELGMALDSGDALRAAIAKATGES